MSVRKEEGFRLGTGLALFLVLAAGPVAAQSISGLAAVKNAGNSPDFFQDDLTVGRERRTTVGILLNTGLVARVRYQAVVAADAGAFSSTSITQASDYNVNFTVTAPGAYDLLVTTSLNGAFTIVDDGDGPGNADLTAVTGTQTGGTLASGTLNLSDPGSRSAPGNTPFNVTSAAVIQGTSNGSPVAHSLRFTWSGSCSSNNGLFTGGDECAVRLGLTANYSGETASDYPGVGGRNPADDGHFVSITLVSLCGDGVVQGTRGEQCDLGSLNGSPDACCTANCQLRPSGHVCRPAAGVCDLTETCNGVSPSCPSDAKSTGVCRPSAGDCDPAESCNGFSNDCPADAKRPNGFVCRAAAGTCDVAETCDGVSNACPADVLVPNGTVCRAAGGVCDIAETCDGVNPACPANALEPNTTVCRPAAGVCDEVEKCDGVNIDCPSDAFLGSTSGSFICRPAAGPCDVDDLCDGSGPNCPADGKRPNGHLCRAAVDVCDLAEYCDGVSNACPVDGLRPPTYVCRPSSDPCDLAETCTGTNTSCPPDTGLPDTDTDGVCDALDNCDAIANPTQSNADADALGDACDPCTNIVPTVQQRARLTVSRIQAPGGDERVSFRGAFLNVPASPTIDPVTNGLRFLMTDNAGATVVDVTLPGGAYNPATRAGWRANGSGTGWTYRNAGNPLPLVGGITRAQLRATPSVPGRYRFAIRGKNGTYTVNPANLPLVGTIVIDVPFATTGQCGEAKFNVAPAACTLVSGGKTVRCK